MKRYFQLTVGMLLALAVLNLVLFRRDGVDALFLGSVLLACGCIWWVRRGSGMRVAGGILIALSLPYWAASVYLVGKLGEAIVISRTELPVPHEFRLQSSTGASMRPSRERFPVLNETISDRFRRAAMDARNAEVRRGDHDRNEQPFAYLHRAEQRYKQSRQALLDLYAADASSPAPPDLMQRVAVALPDIAPDLDDFFTRRDDLAVLVHPIRTSGMSGGLWPFHSAFPQELARIRYLCEAGQHEHAARIYVNLVGYIALVLQTAESSMDLHALVEPLGEILQVPLTGYGRVLLRDHLNAVRQALVEAEDAVDFVDARRVGTCLYVREKSSRARLSPILQQTPEIGLRLPDSLFTLKLTARRLHWPLFAPAKGEGLLAQELIGLRRKTSAQRHSWYSKHPEVSSATWYYAALVSDIVLDLDSQVAMHKWGAAWLLGEPFPQPRALVVHTEEIEGRLLIAAGEPSDYYRRSPGEQDALLAAHGLTGKFTHAIMVDGPRVAE